ncbi:MAG: hypothetical protein M1838_000884 [Thelocarpon superellum]|nr:MAG: hypothetical protein M1838_000884 [Thelocarpon superellum]
MSSSASFKPAAALPRPAPYQVPSVLAGSTAPAGTFASGTKIQVGSHKVIIDRYLSEGGFAHVYLVKLTTPTDGPNVVVLKRVAVPDKDALANMRTEVETMKKLKGHRAVVTYIDSHASQLKGGGYEVFLLMEYCAGGGLIDFMNTRLQNRLTEPEVLKIFSDVAEGVACMHYLKPPLLHRDLKVENVLISSRGATRRYKLCDFGSTAPPRPAPTSAVECRVVEEDIQKHTTLQYRSPEMIDVYRKQPIDEKSDIWALGVLLYKLCYYTTPFEQQGQLAILNASFKFPPYPSFSDRLKALIASMLREQPHQRPTIYQVMREACVMQGIEVPIKDIYGAGNTSEGRRNQRLLTVDPTISSPPKVGAVKAAPEVKHTVIPAIVPMRRGRPGTATQQPQTSNLKPSPSPLRGRSSDPFSALDAPSTLPTNSHTQDELSARFPTLDEFSLLHETGTKFEFDQASPVSTVPAKDITQRVTERLADDAFAQPARQESAPTARLSQKVTRERSAGPSVAREGSHALKPTTSAPLPIPKKSGMVSQGTMTSPSPSPPEASTSRFPIGRLAKISSTSAPRSSSQPRPSESLPSESRARRVSPSASDLRVHMPTSTRPSFTGFHRSRSQISVQPLPPASSRPSPDGPRPSSADINSLMHRSHLTNSRPRPTSAYVASDVDFMRGQDSAYASVPHLTGSNRSPHVADLLPAAITGGSGDDTEDGTIASNVDFLRAMEEQDGSRKREKRSSSGSKSSKRSSMPSISLATTKTLLAGRFGDAFRRFEGNSNAAPARPASPAADDGRRGLSPIAGSQATGDRSDVEHSEDTESLTPEMKRELERRRLAQEERRVEAAAAEYRQRLANRDPGEMGSGKGGGEQRPPTRAASIQNKVKTLLTENVKPSSPESVTEYGRATDGERAPQTRRTDDSTRDLPVRKPLAREPKDHTSSEPSADFSRYPPPEAPAKPTNPPASARPSAPPKPTNLRRAAPPESSSQAGAPRPTVAGRTSKPSAEMEGSLDDWEENFTKRYPSLGKLELVETTIEKAQPTSVRSKEV